MSEWIRNALPTSIGFCLYRSAAMYLYNSGMGAHASSVGFVSDIGFVLSANAAACVCSLAFIFLALRANPVPNRQAASWIATFLLALGALAERFGPALLGAATEAAIHIVSAALCGIALTMLCLVWIGTFLAQRNASIVLAQVTGGYALCTALSIAYVPIPADASLAVTIASLVASSALMQLLHKSQLSERGQRTKIPPEDHRGQLSIFVCFFVLVGVVGIMHTSVLGSSAEGLFGHVSMELTAILSLAVFASLVIAMGQSISPTSVFTWTFPILIVVLTCMPFLSDAIGPASGSLVIVSYTVCGMVFYLFVIREGRRLRLSSLLLSGIYMLGSSGALLVGLCIGMGLNAASANFGLSLLTMLAFAAIYPLVLVLVLLLRRERTPSPALPDPGLPHRTRPLPSQPLPLPAKAAPPDPVNAAKDPDDLGIDRTKPATSGNQADQMAPARNEFLAALSAISQNCGLTRREREVLAYLAAGRSIRYIAETLVISENTAWTHAKRIYAKTGTHGKQGLMDLIDQTVATMR